MSTVLSAATHSVLAGSVSPLAPAGAHAWLVLRHWSAEHPRTEHAGVTPCLVPNPTWVGGDRKNPTSARVHCVMETTVPELPVEARHGSATSWYGQPGCITTDVHRPYAPHVNNTTISAHERLTRTRWPNCPMTECRSSSSVEPCPRDPYVLIRSVWSHSAARMLSKRITCTNAVTRACFVRQGCLHSREKAGNSAKVHPAAR